MVGFIPFIRVLALWKMSLYLLPMTKAITPQTPLTINIYILNLPAFTVTKKNEKKKTPEFRDNNNSNHCLGKKEKDFVTPVEKNQEICNQLVKRTKTHHKCGNATITKSAQYK